MEADMNLDNTEHMGSGQPDSAHSDDGGAGSHDVAELDHPGNNHGDGPSSEDGEEDKVQSHVDPASEQEATPLYLLIQDDDTDDDACESIKRTENWQTMVNNPTSDESKETPLHIAARKGFVEMAKLLLGADADVNAVDESKMQPLHRACEGEYDELVEILCDHGAVVVRADEDGWFPIHFASWKGLKASTVQRLLGPDELCLNKREQGTQWTPLNLAAYHGNQETVSTLLKFGADPAITDSDGWTPLMTAIKQRHYNILDQLLTHLKSNNREDIINIQDVQGKTVLMELLAAAAKDGEFSQQVQNLIAKLLQLGPRFEVTDRASRTVLHHAMGSAVDTKDSSVALEILSVAKGSTLLWKDKQGRTAFDVALIPGPDMESPHEVLDEIIDVLKRGDLKNKLLCWLVQREDMHDRAKKLLLQVPEQGNPDEDLEPEGWGLVEWIIFRRLPQVLLSYVTAMRQISPDSKERNPEMTINVNPKLTTWLNEEEDRNKRSAANTPLPTSERGKKRDDRGREGEDEGQDLRDIKDILDFYLVDTTHTYWENPELSEPTAEVKRSLEEFHAAVIELRQDDHEFTAFVKSRTVDEVLYKNEPLETLGSMMKRFQKLLPKSNEPAGSTIQSADVAKGFTWIHFPSTNMDWMTDIMKKVTKQFDCDPDELQNLFSFLRASWVQTPDKTSSARFMRPQYVERKAGTATKTDLNIMNNSTETGGCKDESALLTSATANSEGAKKRTNFDSSALYMPFLSFSTYHKEPSHCRVPPRGSGATSQGIVHQELLEAYKGHAIHCSPTLDEFYYQFATDQNSCHDRCARNQGQVVTKYLHEENLKDSWSLLRVSQLWIWVLEDKWMISSTSCVDSNANNRFVLDILAHLHRRTEYGNRRGPKSPAELSEVIVEFCIGNFEKKDTFDDQGRKQDKAPQQEGSGSRKGDKISPSKATDGQSQDARPSSATGEERSIRQIFSDSINKIGREEAVLFRKFLRHPKKDTGKGDEEDLSKFGVLWYNLKRLSKPSSKMKTSTSSVSTGAHGDTQGGQTEPLTTETLQEATQQAARLLFEIKDIRDELNIMRTVAQFQLEVQSAMKRHANNSTHTNYQSPKGSGEGLTAEYACNNITELDKVADQIQESVRTTISLQESEIANLQAIEALKEAKRMTVFTITSIVFLPLSFVTSLFALDVSSFLEAPRWSFAVIFTIPLPFLVLAYVYVYGSQNSDASGEDSSKERRKKDKVANGGPSKIPERSLKESLRKPGVRHRGQKLGDIV